MTEINKSELLKNILEQLKLNTLLHGKEQYNALIKIAAKHSDKVIDKIKKSNHSDKRKLISDINNAVKIREKRIKKRRKQLIKKKTQLISQNMMMNAQQILEMKQTIRDLFLIFSIQIEQELYFITLKIWFSPNQTEAFILTEEMVRPDEKHYNRAFDKNVAIDFFKDYYKLINSKKMLEYIGLDMIKPGETIRISIDEYYDLLGSSRWPVTIKFFK